MKAHVLLISNSLRDFTHHRTIKPKVAEHFSVNIELLAFIMIFLPATLSEKPALAAEMLANGL